MIKNIFKNLPVVNSLVKTNAWQSFRHRMVLLLSNRNNSTFTGFLRLPTQFEALTGPVINFLLKDGMTKSLKITVIGCSNGAEVYTIASVLKNRLPKLMFAINAYDIDKEMISKARTACYQQQEVFNNKVITDTFINSTFNIEKGLYIVKKDIACLVRFDVVDVLNSNLKGITGISDIVFAQNFIFHMRRKTAKAAFNNVCSILNSKAVLFIDGIDIDIRLKLAKRNNLEPLEYKIEEIHNEAMMARGVGWPYSYWGLEPFSMSDKDWKRRYSTIFLRS
ncbi:MAG: CheR family methyltransferase [Nitrospirota bacterium]